MDFCPEGTIGPSNDKKCPAPKVAVEPLAQTMGCVLKQTVDQNIFRPFRAGLGLGRFLGLKPQAESCCPFGTEIHGDLYAESAPHHPCEPSITALPEARPRTRGS
jgi:hypothetical protein